MSRLISGKCCWATDSGGCNRTWLSEPGFSQDFQDYQNYSTKNFLPEKILAILKTLTKSWFRLKAYSMEK